MKLSLSRIELYFKETAPSVYWSLGLSIFFAIGLSIATCFNELVFQNSAYDFGIHVQAIWKLSSFNGFFNTVRGMNIWGDHVWLIMPIFSIPYMIWASPYLLLILQTAIIASGGVAIFLLAKKIGISPWFGLILTILYFLYPSVTNMLLENFHPEIVACAFLLWAMVSIQSGKKLSYWIFIVLSLFCKEDVSIPVFLFGIYVFFKHGKLQGIATMLAAIIYFVLVMKLILPVMNGEGFFRFSGGYWFSTFAENWANPSFYMATFSDPRTLHYLYIIFIPLLFIPLLSPLALLPALAPLIINILSKNDYLISGKYHYESLIIPFLFLATIIGLKNLRIRALKIATIGIILIFSIPIFNIQSDFNFDMYRDRWEWINYNETKQKEMVINLIPKDPNVSVSASHLFVTRLANRKQIYMFPNPWKLTYWGIRGENYPVDFYTDYVIVDKQQNAPEDLVILTDLLNSGKYQTVYDEGSLCLLKKN